LSAAHFRRATLVYSIASALAGSGLAPTRFVLEITETVLLQKDQAILETLRQIRDLGVRFSMDDFGTGYCSLSYLRRFPFDKIKIDRSFTQELGKQEDCTAIVRAVTLLGSSLGMVTIAEGVKTREQIFRAEGRDPAQGFLFSRPAPLALAAQVYEPEVYIPIHTTAPYFRVAPNRPPWADIPTWLRMSA